MLGNCDLLANPRDNFYAPILGFGKPYKTIIEEVEVGGYICGETQKATIWRPDIKGAYPLVSFAHGWHDGGDAIHYYDKLNSGLAAQGYIVIGNMSAPSAYCKNEYLDQIHTIEWASTNTVYKGKIDWSKKVGIMGHSMGGQSTQNTAADEEAVKKWKIGAAIALHPAYTKGSMDPFQRKLHV